MLHVGEQAHDADADEVTPVPLIMRQEEARQQGRVEHDDRGAREEQGVRQGVFGDEPALRERGEGHAAEHRHEEQEDSLGHAVDAPQDDVMVEDEHQGQDGRTDIVQEALNARGDGRRVRNGRSYGIPIP